jgi:hypothetical protein
VLAYSGHGITIDAPAKLAHYHAEVICSPGGIAELSSLLMALVYSMNELLRSRIRFYSFCQTCISTTRQC